MSETLEDGVVLTTDH